MTTEEIVFSIQEIQESNQECEQTEQILVKRVPERIFIVPYRNRPQQKFFFSKQMSFLLEDADDYEIFFVHQNDTRYFNRGAMKNIGFLAMKEKYPEDYQNMNFIFNDVDTLPFNKLFDYATQPGIVKHYYGFEYALGGIVVIKGGDFEKVNGYPNYWGWGMEDACLQKRCLVNKIQIDRSQFYTIGSPEILQLFDGVSRLVSKKDPLRMKNDNGMDGLCTIRDLNFTINNESANPADNEFMLAHKLIQVVNVNQFVTGVSFQKDSFHEYDLRDPVNKLSFPDKSPTQKMMISQEEWKNIPYNKEFQEKNTQIMKHQQQQEQQQLIQEKRKEILHKRQEFMKQLHAQQQEQIQQLQKQQHQRQQAQQQLHQQQHQRQQVQQQLIQEKRNKFLIQRQEFLKQQQQKQQYIQQNATYIFSQENARRIEAQQSAIKTAAKEEAQTETNENIMTQKELVKSTIASSQKKNFNISLGGLR